MGFKKDQQAKEIVESSNVDPDGIRMDPVFGPVVDPPDPVLRKELFIAAIQSPLLPHFVTDEESISLLVRRIVSLGVSIVEGR